MKKIQHAVEYGLVRLLEMLVKLPPVSVAILCGEALGRLAKRLLPTRDALIVSNLTAAFPEKSAAEVRRIADAVWGNLGRVAVEFIRAAEILTPDVVRIDGLDVFRQALAEGKGVIVLSPHFCNWEYTGILIQKFVHPVVAVVRPMRNPLVDAWLKRKRSSSGVPFILHRKAAKETLRLLRAKGAVGILCDQNLYKGGVFATFFGRPAATTTLPALLHVRTGAPVILTHVRRDGGVYRLGLERLELPGAGEGEARVLAGTQFINDAMEKIIRMRPEWWFWIHNRWKRSGEAAVATGAAS